MMNVKHRTSKYLLIAAYVSMLFTAVCHAESVDTIYSWTAGSMEGWTNGYSGVTLSNPGDYLRMSFAAQDKMPQNQMDFEGTQVASGVNITNIQFSFNNELMPAGGIWLAFHSAGSGTMWMRKMSITAVGEWVDSSVDVSFASGWAAGSRTSEENFNTDVQTVDWVGIFVQRNGSTAAQSYGLDDFRVTGYTGAPPELPAPPVDTDGDGMTDDWEIANGFDFEDSTDGVLDSDGDGMSNFAEYLTGTDPNDSSSIFGVGVSPSNRVDSIKGFMLEWKSQSGRTYDVLRATNLSEGFSVLESDVMNTPPKNVYHDTTATNGAAFFYKVRVRE